MKLLASSKLKDSFTALFSDRASQPQTEKPFTRFEGTSLVKYKEDLRCVLGSRFYKDLDKDYIPDYVRYYRTGRMEARSIDIKSLPRIPNPNLLARALHQAAFEFSEMQKMKAQGIDDFSSEQVCKLTQNHKKNESKEFLMSTALVLTHLKNILLGVVDNIVCYGKVDLNEDWSQRKTKIDLADGVYLDLEYSNPLAVNPQNRISMRAPQELVKISLHTPTNRTDGHGSRYSSVEFDLKDSTVKIHAINQSLDDYKVSIESVVGKDPGTSSDIWHLEAISERSLLNHKDKRPEHQRVYLDTEDTLFRRKFDIFRRRMSVQPSQRLLDNINKDLVR
jgi:hypothetical protein